MEHDVFVPVAAERLREALADPVRVARAVPGLQQDAGAEPVTGRLKLRVGGHSITYRGTARVTPRSDGTYAVEGRGGEARGSGAVTLALVLGVRPAEGGTTLTFTGTASAEGRVRDLPADAVSSAVTRLLNRFAEQLAADAASTGDAGDGTTQASEPVAEEEAEEPDAGETPPQSDERTSELPSPEGEPTVFGAAPDGAAAPKDASAADEAPADATPAPDPTPAPPADLPDLPAEAAHARRTMIGRSAEEVDHAPPRGRYAPVPAPQTVAPRPHLRWAVPAALAVASAIVAGRVLRRRH